MRLARIVVGLDGSLESGRAAELAGDLAQATGADVLGVHAVGLLEGAGPDGVDHAVRRRELLARLEGTWAEPLRREGVRSWCELADGNPVESLLAAIDEVDADLVIVGSRGLGTVPTQLLGSTSAQLVCVAPCPVLIVPPVGRRLGPAA